MELEKKIKYLQEEFSRIPRVHIKSVLSVNDGDLSEARKQLAKLTNNVTFLHLNLMATKPSEVSTQSSSDSAKEFEGSVNNAGNRFSVTDNGKEFGSRESTDAGSSSSLKEKTEEITPATTTEKEKDILVENKKVPCYRQKRADLNEFQGVSEMELEKKFKELQEEFVRIPRVFIKSILSVNDGDLSKARKRLRELFPHPNFMAIKSKVSRESSSDSATEESVNNAGNRFSVTDNGKGPIKKEEDHLAFKKPGLWSGKKEIAEGANEFENSKNQFSEPGKANELKMNIDPDVMEYVTSTSHHDQLKRALAAKKSEIIWKMNDKRAIVVYRGTEKTDSWQSESLEEIQNFLGKFTTLQVEIKREFWEAVKTQLSSIRACFRVDPPLIKPIDDAFVTKMVCLSSDAKTFEDQLKAKLEEVYHAETRKNILTKERLILLKMKFKLQEINEDVEIQLEPETDEINSEGSHSVQAKVKFNKLTLDVVEKKLNVSKAILEVLGSDQGQQTMKRELEKNKVEAIFTIDKEASVVGTSSLQADEAASLVNKLTLEEKVPFDDDDQYLLKTPEWRQQCEELNSRETICVYQKNGSDTFVAGFREDVKDAIKKLNTYVEKHSIRTEQFTCPSKLFKRYLSELRQDDLRSIETQLTENEVKIKDGNRDDEFVICGKKEGLRRARRELNNLLVGLKSEKFELKQPGLKKFFSSEKGNRLIKLIERENACVIDAQTSFGIKPDDINTQATETADDLRDETGVEGEASYEEEEESDEEEDDNDDDEEEEEQEESEEEEAIARRTGPFSLITTHGQISISGKTGNIETEKAEILVSSKGACSEAIIGAAGQDMKVKHPNPGEITVTPGYKLACSHVIHTTCCEWNGGKSETALQDIVHKCLEKGQELGVKSIAFPVIGTGNLHFPPDEASRIMLEEVIRFCLKNPSSTVKDIRFVLYKENSALVAAFQQAMANFLSTQKLFNPKVSPHYDIGGFMRNLQAKLRIPVLPFKNTTRKGATKVKALDIKVIKGDLTQEKTEAIMNINSTDMDMTKAGALSKAIRIGGGLQLQQECSQLGQQTPGSAVMTSGGGLAVKHIIHIIPGSADTNHLQKCLEVGLDLADKNNLQSISIPCVGTGGFGLDGAESAQLTFQALEKFREHCKSIRKVRIVVFLDGIMQDFVQARQTHAVEQDADEPDRRASSSGAVARQLRKRRSRKTAGSDYCLKICVVGNDQAKVQKAVDFLKEGFSESITSHEIKDDTISRLSQRQIDTLTRKAEERDVKLDIEVHSERIVLQGETSEVLAMITEISREIKERRQKIQEEEKLLLVSKNVEWSYEINKVRTVVDPDTNKKIEEAYSKRKDEVKVSLGGEKFVLNLKENTGQSQKKGKKSEHKKLKLFRKVKPLDEGIPLPKNWAPMPRTATVHTVKLSPGSGEYQNVLQKVKATASGVNIQKIERVQNPHLYQSYMVRKEKMDKDKKGTNEQQLFHGTNADNVAAINTQGFNRSLCGVHGTLYGQGVYFARDASYSVNYAGGEACRQMYLARVLVGQYCQGDPSMKVPPPKDPSRPEILYESVVDDTAKPSIFVVFYDNQCYPEYLITFQ